MAPGARNKFDAPMFEPKVFRVLCSRKYIRACWEFSAPGALCPLSPSEEPD